ncbi:hypothetical protein BIT28_24465 [Photobacterium proteolyticum]|uniref:Alpha/beta hydrolase n=1 Tax=Photobacterium proteolyticum TaxID=1903952 RepID=A0A1Q9GCR9_9GAMM|nr:hypothetical protein [Photobacterium proteolyticum]OLQ72181.1 hypothetical protein BIT28_24465 [Photobacterium proteolyticum]
MPLVKPALIVIASCAVAACANNTAPNEFTSRCGYFQLQGDKPLTFTVNSPTEANLDGVICSGSLDAFNDMLARYPDIKKLDIDVIGGSADDEVDLELSKQIHDRKMSTHLNKEGMIASGGVDLYLAGVARSADDAEPRIGVHSWGGADGENGNQVPATDPIHQMYLSYYRHVDIDPKFYWFTLNAAPATDIHWMNKAEIKRYQVITSN